MQGPPARRGHEGPFDVPAPPSNPDRLDALRRAGFDVATLAGNHMADAGPNGIEDTIATLRGLGVKKGDRVAIYRPRIPELAVAMLACARIGAVHTVIFAGFSAEAIRDRVNDCSA